MTLEEMIAERDEIKRQISKLEYRKKVIGEEIRIARYGEEAAFEHGPMPKSGVYGVRQDTRTGRWHARIRQYGQQRFLGSFETKEEAVAARKEAIQKRVAFAKARWAE